MTTAPAPRPVPLPDASSEEYWRAAAEHRLAMQRCAACGWYSYPPAQICTNCLSPDRSFRFEPLSGRGRLKSWTVVRDAFLPGFKDDVPYVVAEVELAEQPGLTMVGRLLDGADAPLALGAAVEVAFEDLADGVAVPAFTLSEEGRS